MHLEVRYRAPIARRYPENYIREITVDVLDYDDTSVQEFLLGRISFCQILYEDIESDGEDPVVICDEFSSTLVHLWLHFMHPSGDSRDEFATDDITRSVVLLEKCLLHPGISFAAIHVCEAAMRVFDMYTLLVSWRDDLPLSDRELADIGFCKAAETNMVYRRTVWRREYDSKYPRGEEIDFEATEEHEEWVEREWEQLGP